MITDINIYQAFWALMLMFAAGHLTGYYIGLWRGRHEELLKRINNKAAVESAIKNNPATKV